MSKKQEKTVGRPTEIDRPTRRVYLTLDDETIEKAKRIGNGNVSAGVRMAVASKREPRKE